MGVNRRCSFRHWLPSTTAGKLTSTQRRKHGHPRLLNIDELRQHYKDNPAALVMVAYLEKQGAVVSGARSFRLVPEATVATNVVDLSSFYQQRLNLSLLGVSQAVVAGRPVQPGWRRFLTTERAECALSEQSHRRDEDPVLS